MPADLIIYALVAAGLVFWLRSVLGTRHGEERERPSPFLAGEGEDGRTDGDQSALAAGPMSMEDEIAALASEPRGPFAIENKTAEMGLIEIARADKSFDIGFFLQAAQDAFVIIVESFAEGDRETLHDLLGDDVYQAFEGAITAREAEKHTQVTDVHAIRRTEVTAARMEGRSAVITVKFEAEETSVVRDMDGHVITGDPDRTAKVKDMWTFSRDIKSKDPSWLVIETRSGFEDDHELIPNTH
ncbi:MAG: Tim44 domain-containing protein [Alphaproteobacteria bacterium]|nr:Tim44 domain-containing protein [Alphaproteobacteria bacterium]